MPRISYFYGIAIEMYYDDHPGPHFHVRYGDESAKIEIASGKLVVGRLSVRPLRLVRKWAHEHRRGWKKTGYVLRTKKHLSR